VDAQTTALNYAHEIVYRINDTNLDKLRSEISDMPWQDEKRFDLTWFRLMAQLVNTVNMNKSSGN